MEEEITSIEKNDTWKLVKAPKSCKPIGVKWVYKLKKNPLGEMGLIMMRYLLMLLVLNQYVS